ncbi:unnamed protein product [marine sediment metagenome]|uniref:Uncharacterized protein n=1 Tax=marine sediment metagenome TaxID=412755 RepID=X1RIK8_9ZZZZ
MLESVLKRALQAIFGDGSDISILNPMPVTDRAGGKAVAGLLNRDTILAGATTTLYDCAELSLNDCSRFLALTVQARYNAGATAGIKVHVITSPTGTDAGAHTGGMGAAVLDDENAHFRIPDGLVGLRVHNGTDGSEGVITGNTETTVTAALAGGVANVWNTGDDYWITGAGYDTEDFDTWEPGFVADTFIRQTKVYDPDPIWFKVLIENLDAVNAVTDVSVLFAYENRT